MFGGTTVWSVLPRFRACPRSSGAITFAKRTCTQWWDSIGSTEPVLGISLIPRTGCCHDLPLEQARNQLWVPRGAKSFLRGAHIFCTVSNSFKLCPTHFSRGEEKFYRGGCALPAYGPVLETVIMRQRVVSESWVREPFLKNFESHHCVYTNFS